MLRWRSPTGYDTSFGRTGKSSPITSAKLVGVGAASQRLIWKREQSTRGRLLSGGVVREPIKTDVLGEDALTGSGSGATLQPGFATTKKITLTVQSLLTFKADATYSFRLKSKAAEVTAGGVTIENGAEFCSHRPESQAARGAVPQR